MSVLNCVFADSNIEENQIPDMTDVNAVMDHITDGIGNTEDLVVTDNSISEESNVEGQISEQSISEESNTEEPIPETPISAEPIPNEAISEDEVIPETPIKPIPEEPIPEEIIPEEIIPEEIIPEEIIPEEPIIEEPIIIDETEPVNYDDLVDAEKYIMENYTSMTEEDVIGIIWPEMNILHNFHHILRKLLHRCLLCHR
ncbi:hypothetical protein [Anaerovorax sp. IOR16]|uniref:hypothetical protein n=1 Tax=Anaerovorax sp. IOR16 TaxID=2773458 RepID=UPI0019D15A65|nr:hypothetical protein [Anaerovorax sp. IOR16]